MENKELIFYGVFVLGVIYLTIMYIMQRRSESKNHKALNKAKADYDDAKEARNQNKEKIVERIIDVYGYEIGRKVRDGILWVGMPQHLLMLAKGKANSIKQSVDTDSVMQVWVYSDYTIPNTHKKGSLEVTIKNGNVSNWSEVA